MPRIKEIEMLNGLLATQCHSLANYLSDSPAWTHPGNEELLSALRSIVADHDHYAQRIADAIDQRKGTIHSGSFPMTFASLNDLGLDYLLSRLIDEERRDIQTIEQCVAKLSEDPQARSLACEVLGSERAHLEILEEFLFKSSLIPRDNDLLSSV